MHVLDLDNDGLISRDELGQALRFLRENLAEEDLMALLDSLAISTNDNTTIEKGEHRLIPVAELRRLAEEAGAARSGGAGGVAAGAPPLQDKVEIHTL